MSQNFFVTGLPKSGKTTLLSRIVEELKSHGFRVGGFISPEEKEHGTRTGFYVRDIDSGEIGLLADVNADGPKVSKYHVDIKSFEDVILPALRKFDRYDVIVIDEIGRMELKSGKFSELLDRLLESHTPLIASLHNDFVERYGQSGEVIFLEAGNREGVYSELIQKITAIGKRGIALKPAPRRAAVKKRKKAKPLPKQMRKKEKAPPKEAKKVEKKPKKKEKKEAGKKGEKGVAEHLKELLGF